MAQDFGIKITQPGHDIHSATGANVIMNTAYPFIKLNTQSDTSFQSILLLITNDPPEPVGPATDAYTIVYQFAHGYSYIPSVETLFYLSTPPPGTAFSQTYFQDSGVIAQQTVDDEVILYSVADATNVYFIIDKFNDGAGSPNNLSGTTVEITCHVFLDDLSGQ